MRWQELAGTAADLGLPILATAFGIPGPVATFAAKMVKKALGLPASASADDVQSTIEGMDPEVAKAALEGAQSDVAAEYAYLTRIVEIQGQNATEVNKTIRAEIGKVSWWHWRHLSGYVPFIIGVEVASLLPLMVMGKITPTDFAAIIGSVTPFLTVFAAMVGVVAVNNTTRAAIGVTGEVPETIASKVTKAILPKRK